MPQDRFFLDAILETHALVTLKGDEHHHLAKVMRCQTGDKVELINGHGCLANAVIEAVEKASTTLLIEACETHSPLLPQITLWIPLMRPSKLEWVVEKGCEIGVDRFFFFPAEKGEKDDLNPHKIERLFNVRLAAVKQSGRLFFPTIEFVASLQTLLECEGAFYYGDWQNASSEIEFSKEPVNFVSGPEKGFSEKEKKLLSSHGKPLILSPYILRAETAPLVAAARMVQAKNR